MTAVVLQVNSFLCKLCYNLMVPPSSQPGQNLWTYSTSLVTLSKLTIRKSTGDEFSSSSYIELQHAMQLILNENIFWSTGCLVSSAAGELVISFRSVIAFTYSWTLTWFNGHFSERS